LKSQRKGVRMKRSAEKKRMDWVNLTQGFRRNVVKKGQNRRGVPEASVNLEGARRIQEKRGRGEQKRQKKNQ